MIKITKLPPGKAAGADDLRLWGQRRLAGKSGLFKPKKRRKKRYLPATRIARQVIKGGW